VLGFTRPRLRLAEQVGTYGIDLVLTDIDMPILNGIQLVRRLKKLRPDLKILYMTGHRGALVDELLDEGTVIEKPFAYSTLVRGVDACLAEALPSRSTITQAKGVWK
jgi:two-component system cell cycle sensor histidine kinase/response regulator CckA